MYNEQIYFSNPNRPVIIKMGAPGKHRYCRTHFHGELEFLYVKSGSMVCITDKGTTTIHAGEVAFFNSNVPHATEGTEISQNILIQFRDPTAIKSNLKYLGKFLRRNNVSEYVFHLADPDTAELCSYMESMVQENQYRESAYDYYITANIYAIVALLHRKKLLSDRDDVVNLDLIEKIMPVIDCLDKNFRDSVTLKDLSGVINLNEQYLCRLFKQATGTTITDYLNFVRICEAERLLKAGESVSEVAYKTGFSSLSYFNRMFKKHKLYSPSEYKKISRRRDDLIK